MSEEYVKKMPPDISVEESKGRLTNTSGDERYSAALQVARQLNADKRQALKPQGTLIMRQILPVAIGVTSVAGTALAGAVTLVKVLRGIARWRRAIQAKPTGDSVQESRPEPSHQSDRGRVLAIINAVEVRTDPAHSALTVYSRTVVVHQAGSEHFIKHHSSE
jgi:hypothetical protein